MNKKKIASLLIFCIFSILAISSCGTKSGYVGVSFMAMDTLIEVKIPPGTPNSDVIFENCKKITLNIEALISAEIESSDIGRFNASEKGCTVSRQTGDLFLCAKKIWQLSGGSFDPTTYPATLLWRKSAEDNKLPTEAELYDAAGKRGMNKIEYDPKSSFLSKYDCGIMLDFGAIGKGYAESEIKEYLDSTDAEYGVLSFGGNISVFGKKPRGDFSIMLRDPTGNGSVGEISLSSGFISVSGGYERFFEINDLRYCHILNPDTAKPVSGRVQSTAIISDNGAAADAISTALFVSQSTDSVISLYRQCVGTEFEFEAIVILENEIQITPGLSDLFSPRGKRTITVIG